MAGPSPEPDLTSHGATPLELATQAALRHAVADARHLAEATAAWASALRLHDTAHDAHVLVQRPSAICLRTPSTLG